MKLTTAALLLSFVLAPAALPARAQPASQPASGNHASHHPAAEMTDAEVRKVDRETGKLTLKHAPIKNLDMPAMTMVFTARDKALLAKVKPGDKVKFSAVNEAGQYIVTDLQVAP